MRLVSASEIQSHASALRAALWGECTLLQQGRQKAWKRTRLPLEKRPAAADGKAVERNCSVAQFPLSEGSRPKPLLSMHNLH